MQSPGNSQQLLDGNSFSHAVHGFLFYLAEWEVLRRWRWPARLVAAVPPEAG